MMGRQKSFYQKLVDVDRILDGLLQEIDETPAVDFIELACDGDLMDELPVAAEAMGKLEALSLKLIAFNRAAELLREKQEDLLAEAINEALAEANKKNRQRLRLAAFEHAIRVQPFRVSTSRLNYKDSNMTDVEIDKWQMLEMTDAVKELVTTVSEQADRMDDLQEQLCLQAEALSAISKVLPVISKVQQQSSALLIGRVTERQNVAAYNASAYLRGIGSSWEEFEEEYAEEVAIVREQGVVIEQHGDDVFVCGRMFWHIQLTTDRLLSARLIHKAMKNEQFEAKMQDEFKKRFPDLRYVTQNEDDEMEECYPPSTDNYMPDEWFDEN